MRHRKLISWMLTLSAAAMLGSWASRAGMQAESAAGAGPASVVQVPGEPIPDPEERLLEQINTLGPEAMPAVGRDYRVVTASCDEWGESRFLESPIPGDGEPDAGGGLEKELSMPASGNAHVAGPGLAGVGNLPAWLGWTVLIGGTLMAAIPAAHLFASRRRRTGPAPVADRGAGSAPPSSGVGTPVAGDAVPRAEFETEVRRIRESILEVVQLVESIHRRIEETPGSMHSPESGDPEVAEADCCGVLTDEPEARGPWTDRDLSLAGSSSGGSRDDTFPAPSTADGRDLTAIRRAVLRLADEGWRRERIAERLRLGHGDVGLILKSGRSSGSAGERVASLTGRS